MAPYILPPNFFFFALAVRQTVYCLFENCATEEKYLQTFLLRLGSFSPSTKITVMSQIYHEQTKCFDTHSEMM